MKTYTIFITSILLLGLMSCSDELELEPKSQLTLDSFFTTESDFEQAINGTYSALRSDYDDITLFADIHSDNTVPEVSGTVTTQREFNDFNIVVDNIEILNRWNDSYLTIYRANTVLNRIDDAEIDNAVKSRLKGEAMFIRGLVYFNLVRIYGKVPLVLTEMNAEEALDFPQSPIDAIYTQIITDLSEAANLLPTSYPAQFLGKATRISAHAILGKVYLTMKNYPQTIATLQKVIDLEGSGVDLLDSYASVFSTSNEMNDEILFAVRWTNDGVNGNAFNFLYTQLLQPSNKGTEDLYNAFEENDVRRGVTLDAEIKDNDILVFKFGPGETDRGESDWPVIRYADVLLMMAEALNEQAYNPTGDAFNLLNRIRLRAELPELTNVEVPNQNAFRLALEQERRVELASEGHRWFDLVRTNRFIDVLVPKGFSVKEHHVVFPIPEIEVLKINDPSVLSQNLGY